MPRPPKNEVKQLTQQMAAGAAHPALDIVRRFDEVLSERVGVGNSGSPAVEAETVPKLTAIALELQALVDAGDFSLALLAKAMWECAAPDLFTQDSPMGVWGSFTFHRYRLEQQEKRR